jgi:Ni/Fe-hydrogenase 1 B-type cytochrome subunit
MTQTLRPEEAAAHAVHGRPLHMAPAADDERRRAVYVLELPVRVAHWAIVLAILVLSVSGWWIGTANLPARELDMQTVRFVHICAAWVMIAAMLTRVIWMFTGNEYASWREWIPSNLQRVKEAIGIVTFYFGFRRVYPEPPGGHNVIAGLSYAGVYALLAFMALSGFALESAPGAGDWRNIVAAPVLSLGLATLRWLHHNGMWVIWAFVAIHVSIATLIDAETRGNCYNAIISGWRPRLRWMRRADLPPGDGTKR